MRAIAPDRLTARVIILYCCTHRHIPVIFQGSENEVISRGKYIPVTLKAKVLSPGHNYKQENNKKKTDENIWDNIPPHVTNGTHGAVWPAAQGPFRALWKETPLVKKA